MSLSHSVLIKRAFTSSLLGIGLLLSPVSAQEETTEPLNIVSELVEPRFSGTFQTGPGAGYESSFGSLYGFVPFAQKAGVSTFYGEGRFSAFTEGGGQNGNLRAGYRRFLPKSNLVFGGYAGWDVRQTGANKTFQQLGLGAEVLGQKWEARINGYIPLGDNRQTVASNSTDTGLIGSTETVVSDLRFVQNQLLYSIETGSQFRQQTESTRSEAAMSGFDIEAGYQLSKWDNGKLFAYGGLYFLDAEGRDAFVGVRGRLRAEINDVLAGISLSSDKAFGTNLQFSFGLQFGGQRKQKDDDAAESVLARLGQSVQRQEIVAVEQQVETKVTTTAVPGQKTEDVVAVNPETGEEWQFIHVKDGENNSGGTFENPYGEVTDATTEIGATGTVNDIIYVDAGDRSGMSGFTIPGNVKVLSTGVTQEIEIANIGATQLPGSGTGTLPLVQSTVTMGNNTTLSGFEIQTTNERGVYASNVSDFSIDRNTISTEGNNAYGIFVYGRNSTISDASISGNTISTEDDFAHGILALGVNSTTISDASISDNTISTEGDNANGIFVLGRNSTTISDASISGNTISTEGRSARGIYVYGANSTISDASISGNTISTEGDIAYGIYVYGNNSTISDASISGNTISTEGSRANGIFVYGNNSTISDASISENTVSTEGDFARGILVDGSNSTTMSDASISGNTISTTGGGASGIFVFGGNSTTISDASISGNTISTTGGGANGISVSGSNSTISDASISGNTVSQAGASSFVIRGDGAASDICVARFSDNVSTNPNFAGGGGNDLQIILSGGAAIAFVDFANVTANNTGFNDISGTPSSTPTVCP